MKALATIISLLALHTVAATQPEDNPPAFRGRPMEFVSAVPFLLPERNELRIDVHLRIPLSALVPVKNSGGPSPFLRRGELAVECVDSAGTVQGRAIEQIELPAAGPDESSSPAGWIERSVSVFVPPGGYAVQIEVSDLQSRNRILSRIPRLPAWSGTPEARLAFLYTPAGADSTGDPNAPAPIRPANYGNGFHLSTPGGAVIAVYGVPDSVRSADVRFAFKQALDGTAGESPAEEGTVRALPLCGRPSTGFPTEDTLAVDSYRFTPGSGDVRYLVLPLPLERLPLRRYRFEATVTAGGRELRCGGLIPVVWPDQPESLRDVAYAIRALRFILPERSLDSLMEGGFDERVTRLERFWKKRDPTPATADNSLMTEFYRRVDHARMTFATLNERDGTRSDRGRIYILNGPPTRVERTLDPETGYTERWSYDRGGREFLFRDPARNGTYILAPSPKP